MKISRTFLVRNIVFLAVLVVLFAAERAEAQVGARVPNWTVPSASSSTDSTTPAHSRALGDVTIPMSFVAVTPCRIVDTRGPTGPYGAPSLSPGVSRNFALVSGPCTGLPASIGAISLNITVTNTAGPGFIKIYPQGGSAPVVSTLNYVAGQTIANAAIVPAAAGGGVTVVAGVSGTDLIIDVNGYYPYGLINSNESFAIVGNLSGGGIVYGENSSSGQESAGVRGVEDANGSSVSGVLGEVGNLSFLGSFTHGSEGVTGINSFSGVLGLAMNRAVVGVLLDSAGNDLAEGWAGKSGPSSSVFFGLEGILISTTASFINAAGVWGVDIGGKLGTMNRAGVRGDSKNGAGVAGASTLIGVTGVLFDTTGATVAAGDLGNVGGPWGVFAHGDLGATGAKPFVEVHPTDASKEIRYVALEGPEAGTYFRGSSETHNGMAVILVPETFRLVTDTEGLTVQLTPVGAASSMYIVSQDLHQIVVHSSRDVKFHYLVNGVRATFKDWQVVKESEFMPRQPTETMPGYFSEEQKRRLIANGTYNADGTVNMETARRLGWDRIWEARIEADKALAHVNAAESSDRSNK
jgi:hypothetical protein